MITFLFGSGADSDYNARLKSGASFARVLLLDMYAKERRQLVGENYANYKLIHPNSTKVFLQSVASNKELARKMLENEDVDKCMSYYEKGSNEVKYDIIQGICKTWLNALKSEYTDEDKVCKFFLEHAVFFDSLDEKFNSLRVIPHNKNAKKVINAYLSIYILMLQSMFDFEKDFEWTYSNIINLLTDENRTLPPTDEKNNYYSILKNSALEYNVATTNYTNFVESSTSKEVVYLHGKMTWFEDLKHLTIYDCTIESERKKIEDNIENIIPFILIPSGVKPLICSKQIEAFHNFIEQMNQSNLLVIIGYRFNSEDNHINSIINEWLYSSNDNKLIYFNFEESVDFNELGWLIEKTDVEKMEFSDECSLKISDKRISNIVVNETNCHKAFEMFLKKLGGNV